MQFFKNLNVGNILSVIMNFDKAQLYFYVCLVFKNKLGQRKTTKTETGYWIHTQEKLLYTQIQYTSYSTYFLQLLLQKQCQNITDVCWKYKFITFRESLLQKKKKSEGIKIVYIFIRNTIQNDETLLDFSATLSSQITFLHFNFEVSCGYLQLLKVNHMRKIIEKCLPLRSESEEK